VTHPAVRWTPAFARHSRAKAIWVWLWNSRPPIAYAPEGIGEVLWCALVWMGGRPKRPGILEEDLGMDRMVLCVLAGLVGIVLIGGCLLCYRNRTGCIETAVLTSGEWGAAWSADGPSVRRSLRIT
jgi:hypothetical protein